MVQGLLEAAGIPYTGPGVAASAIGMDKALFKRLARGLGLPVTDWREIPSTRWAGEREGVLAELAAFAAANGDERLMIKPARLGSSIGMAIAHDAAERGPALDEAFRFDSLALAERYVPSARELEVAVLGDAGAGLEEYGPGEIIAGREFYDYVAKYTPGLSETSAQAELEPGQRALIRKLARDAYRAIGAEGLRAGRLPRRRGSRLHLRDQHDARVHADQPLSGDGRRGRLRLWRTLPADRRPGHRAPGPADPASRPAQDLPR